MYIRIGGRIKKAREEMRISQAELGTALGVTATAINYYEKGKRKINLDDLYKLALALGKTLEYFLDENRNLPAGDTAQITASKNMGQIVEMVDLPVAGAVPAGSPVPAEQNITGYLPFPGKMSGKAAFALWVRGDSLIGEGIEDGDLVLIHRQPHVDYDGQIACVLVGNEESTLKIFARDQENKVRLKAANPNFPDIVLEDENNMRVLGVYAGVFKLPRLSGKNVL